MVMPVLLRRAARMADSFLAIVLYLAVRYAMYMGQHEELFQVLGVLLVSSQSQPTRGLPILRLPI